MTKDNRRKAVRSNPNREIFITRVHRDYSCDQLYSYMVKCGFHVRGMYQRSHPNSSYKSFVATLTESDAKRAMSSEMWSEGVEVREYVSRD